MLEAKVNQYNTLKAQLDAIKAQMEPLRAEIISEMEAKGLKSVDTENVKLTVKYANYVTYDDKAIGVLKNVAPNCVKEVIDLDTVKASIKAGIITNELDAYKHVETRKSITLKDK